MEYDPNSLPDLLPTYYKRIFPYAPYYRWLNYGGGKSVVRWPRMGVGIISGMERLACRSGFYKNIQKNRIEFTERRNAL